MLDFKQSPLSTLESRRTTQTAISRMSKNQLKYDINDYLPQECNVYPHFVSFGYRDDAQSSQCRTSMHQDKINQYQSGYKQTISNLQIAIKLKDNEIDRINNQYRTKLQQNQSKMIQINNSLQKIKIKCIDMQKQLVTYKQINRRLQQSSSLLKKQKLDIANQLEQLKNIMNKKTKHIGLFCQKYELKLEPRIKHSYTIEVQTQMLSNQTNHLKIQYTDTIRQRQKKSYSIGQKSSSKGFYQAYQEKKKAKDFDLVSEFASKSDVFGSQFKPKKPSIIQNNSQLNNKQNNLKRANRIDAQIGAPRWKQTSKFQQIELYPVEQSCIQDIVRNILLMK